MSSKFGGIPKTQKPPAVCKKGPPPDVVPLPPFVDRFFQGFCEWYDNVGSDQIQLAESIEMIPDSVQPTWTGSTAGNPYNIRLRMEWYDTVQAFDYRISLHLNGHIVGVHERLLVGIRSLEPFDSGLIGFINPPGQEIIQCRIMT